MQKAGGADSEEENFNYSGILEQIGVKIGQQLGCVCDWTSCIPASSCFEHFLCLAVCSDVQVKTCLCFHADSSVCLNGDC